MKYSQAHVNKYILLWFGMLISEKSSVSPVMISSKGVVVRSTSLILKAEKLRVVNQLSVYLYMLE